MINQLDALILARTKLHNHPIRTGVTTIIASLIFGLLLAIVIIAQGTFNSIDKYNTVGLNNRTILSISSAYHRPAFDEYEHTSDPQFISEVDTAYKANVAHKRAVAKKYAVDYNPAVSDPSPIGIDPVTKQKIITIDGLANPIVRKIVLQKNTSLDKGFSITDYVRPYKSAIQLGTNNPVVPADGTLTYMVKGRENLLNASKGNLNSQSGFDIPVTLSIVNGSISHPFIANTSFAPSAGEIPVIVPLPKAESLLGLSQLPKNSDSQAQRSRLLYIRSRIGEVTASFCYRNSASNTLLQQALTQQDEIKTNIGNASYVMPSVVYNVPNAEDCGEVTVKSDKRTMEQKKVDAAMTQFEKEVESWPGDPIQHKVKLRGVGVSADTTTALSSFSVRSLISSMLTPTLGYGTWEIPQDLFNKLPASSRPDEIFSPNMATSQNTSSAYQMPKTYLVEFKNKNDARALLEKTGLFSGANGNVLVTPFGSNTLIVDEMRTWLHSALNWILLIVGLLAVIILWGVVGRTIADSRHESAIYRAIGARRIDIANIYVLYALLLGLRIVFFSVALGACIAAVIDLIFSSDATIGAQLAYAAVETHIRFSLFSLATWYVPLVIGVIIVAAGVASILPVILGVRRNPINDMRDDG